MPGQGLVTVTEIFSWYSSVYPGKLQDSTLKIGHSHFIPYSFYLSTCDLMSFNAK